MSNVTDISTRALDSKADCPVPWCTGTIESHGGDGAPPSFWSHGEDDRQLARMGRGSRWKYGEDPTRFSLVLHEEREYSAEELRTLAHELSALVLQLRQVAVQLDIENGATS